MTNPGVFPVNTATNVGIVRSLIGDLLAQPLSPPVTGEGDFPLFSDSEISVFLIQSNSSPIAAAGWAYLSLSGVAAQNAESLADYDLKYDGRQKAERLREQAAEYFRLAREADAAGTTGFQIVGTGLQYPYWHELAEYPGVSQSGLIV